MLRRSYPTEGGEVLAKPMALLGRNLRIFSTGRAPLLFKSHIVWTDRMPCWDAAGTTRGPLVITIHLVQCPIVMSIIMLIGP